MLNLLAFLFLKASLETIKREFTEIDSSVITIFFYIFDLNFYIDNVRILEQTYALKLDVYV